jgi:acetoin utilization deacetylase AcuC-like enzyme
MAGAPVFLAHPSSLDHDPGPHPEQPARMTAIEDALVACGGLEALGFRPVRSPAVDRSVLEAVHPRNYVEALERVSARGGGQLDLDTAMSAGSFPAALHGAGGAVALTELLAGGEAPAGFSAHRPPGHHALSDRAMGFCLFNHVAIAAQHALDGLGLERVMIFDWDVHHGNGTNDIFYASDRLLFVSIHQFPLYPGTGRTADAGSGAGEGFTVNLPVPAGSGDSVYLSLVDHVVVPLARAFGPQLVLISAGYDAHLEDPLADCAVSDEGFAAMAGSLVSVCQELGTPLGAVLEGGYALGALGRSVAATLAALAGGGDRRGSQPVPEITPVAEAARARLTRWWAL